MNCLSEKTVRYLNAYVGGLNLRSSTLKLSTKLPLEQSQMWLLKSLVTNENMPNIEFKTSKTSIRATGSGGTNGETVKKLTLTMDEEVVNPKTLDKLREVLGAIKKGVNLSMRANL